MSRNTDTWNADQRDAYALATFLILISIAAISVVAWYFDWFHPLFEVQWW